MSRRGWIYKTTHSSSDRGDVSGWTISEYRRCVLSTHGGSSKGRACSCAKVCKGLGNIVDTAYITVEGVQDPAFDQHKKHTLATGWFQPSNFDGIRSPSTQWRNSFHQGVLKLLARSFWAAAASTRSQSSNHLAHLLDIRALIQSIVRPARSSSSSRHPSSTSPKSEKRKAKEVRGTGVNDVVLVVTTYVSRAHRYLE